MRARIIIVLLAGVTLTGCSSLLPSSSTAASAGFGSFEEARLAAERIVPLTTRVVEPLGI